ncbi:unnamed protein product, partial [Closterium sp. Naga37s-1]
ASVQLALQFPICPPSTSSSPSSLPPHPSRQFTRRNLLVAAGAFKHSDPTP